MMIDKLKASRAWLLWTTLFLASMIVLVLFGSGMGATQALAPVEGVTVTKTVNVPSIAPGEMPLPVYTVVFSNSNEHEIVLATITDTLPAGLEFGFMHASSDWHEEPDDAAEPDIVWQGPITIPATSTLTLAYSVLVPASVPPSTEPRVNTVWAATEDGSSIGPATAGIVVGEADLALEKSAWPMVVENGSLVTYTVILSNNGHMSGTVEAISDTLDAPLSFAGMVGSSPVLPAPEEVSGTLTWTGPFTVAPLSALTLTYQAQTPEGDDFLNPCNVVQVGSLTDEVCIAIQPERVYTYLPLAYTGFEHAWFSVEKSVWPTSIVANSSTVVTYTVTIVNQGDTPATLLAISDTLPAGFTFSAIAPGSDLQTPPNGSTGTIAWNGPWAMPPGHQMRLVYRVVVQAPAGQYGNQVRVVSDVANVPLQPALAILVVDEPIAGLTAVNDGPTMLGSPTTLSASVTAGSNVVYEWDLGDQTTGTGASVQHVYPAVDVYTAIVTARNSVSQQSATTTVTIQPAILFEDNFDDPGTRLSRWTRFLNYWRLEEDQWVWEETDGVNGSGAATQDCWLGGKKVAEDALLMYLGEGSENWTDYRVETDMLLRGGVTERDGETVVILEGGYPLGLWVRGHYQDVGEDDTAGWTTGYYVVVGGKSTKNAMFVRLAQLQTETDCWEQACENPQNLYDFNNPHTLVEVRLEDRTLERYKWYNLAVEVRGDNIKVFFDDELVIDYTDVKEPFLTGTIGLKTYKSKTASYDNVKVTPLTDETQ